MVKILHNLLVSDYFKDQRGNISIDCIVATSTEIDNPSIRFDAMGSGKLGRVTLWESGDLSFEILDIDTIQVTEAESFQVKNIKQLIDKIEMFLCHMK